jgi:hypothetical protein
MPQPITANIAQKSPLPQKILFLNANTVSSPQENIPICFSYSYHNILQSNRTNPTALMADMSSMGQKNGERTVPTTRLGGHLG